MYNLIVCTLGKEQKHQYSQAIQQIVAWEVFLETTANDRKNVDTMSMFTSLHHRFMGGDTNNSPVRSDSEYSDKKMVHFSTVLNAMDVCKAVIFYSANMRYHQGKTINLIRAISILFALTPAYLYSNYAAYELHIVSTCFRIFAAIITFAYLNILLLLFYVAIFDMARQYRISRILHKMIRVTHLELTAAVNVGDFSDSSETYANYFSKANNMTCDLPIFDHVVKEIQNPMNKKTESTALRDSINSVMSPDVRMKVSKSMPIPRIDLDRADNVYSWLYTRLVLQNFGFRVRYRINMFVACMLFFTLVLMLVIINKVIETKQIETSNDDDQAVRNLVTNVNFVQSMITTAVFTIFGVLLIYFGSIVNEDFSMHRGAISSYVVRNRSRLYIGKTTGTLSEKEMEDLEEAVDALVVAQEAIEINNETNPYKIVGVEPEGGLMASTATIVAGFYSVVFNLMFPSGGDSNGLEGTF